ncbi:hypothetical protein PF005_g12700 [Phytophthora fragariae]|uniref:Secreted protein n=2 Tax=Phytophthora TaxID=4783 RepID=A0A6A3EVV9_9STRA|nr:hypothetical protein PF003_g22939 [Phytophthora fragariae]KAE8963615.1 hypothetical protein PR002_g29238 [Phytophthora rubi]KAE8936517.1 hypothetical protein PF009_g13562 [Phytophthora fragariae]KAE8963700.1 hypothetical protein PR001_g29288 [Phytophthora rubi]KAE9019050.1 hypothetical protein PF011_g5992 [Phytophthora fragariae]
MSRGCAWLVVRVAGSCLPVVWNCCARLAQNSQPFIRTPSKVFFGFVSTDICRD